ARRAVLQRPGSRARALCLFLEVLEMAVRAFVVGVHLSARCARLRSRALRAAAPRAALAGRRGGFAAARGIVRGACSRANCSQRCIAAGVNSAWCWLRPITNI